MGDESDGRDGEEGLMLVGQVCSIDGRYFENGSSLRRGPISILSPLAYNISSIIIETMWRASDF